MARMLPGILLEASHPMNTVISGNISGISG
jgi:putative cofactor-binding repeat protein